MKYFSQNVNLDRYSQFSIQDLKDMHPHLVPVIAEISNELHYYFGPNFQQSFVQYIIEEEDYRRFYQSEVERRSTLKSEINNLNWTIEV